MLSNKYKRFLLKKTNIKELVITSQVVVIIV